jgi:hypothetical protein
MMADAANPQVDLQQVLDQIATLQGQLVTLQAENQTLASQLQGLQPNNPQPGAAPAGGATCVRAQAPAAFALTPATMEDLTGLLDYSSK